MDTNDTAATATPPSFSTKLTALIDNFSKPSTRIGHGDEKHLQALKAKVGEFQAYYDMRLNGLLFEGNQKVAGVMQAIASTPQPEKTKAQLDASLNQLVKGRDVAISDIESIDSSKDMRNSIWDMFYKKAYTAIQSIGGQGGAVAIDENAAKAYLHTHEIACRTNLLDKLEGHAIHSIKLLYPRIPTVGAADTVKALAECRSTTPALARASLEDFFNDISAKARELAGISKDAPAFGR